MKNLLSLVAICIITSGYAQKNADSSKIYFNKGMQEKEAKRYLVASVFFDKAIQFDPSSKEAYLQNGYTQLDMKRTDAAKACFEKVYLLDPGSKEAVRELMDLYFSYRQFPRAIEFAEKCKDCDNNNRILGMSFYQQEDYPQAEKYLGNALLKNPSDVEVTYTMGRNYLDMEEYTKAVPYYKKAVQMDETRNVWMYELGLLYYNLNDYKNAMSSFENAAAHGYAKSNDFNENLGYASLYSGQFDKGEALLNEIYKRKPGNKDVIRDMAEILYQQKQFDRSLSYCQKLMELDGKDGKALYQAGLCFQKKGEKDRGQQMCDKAIELDPSLENLRKKKEMATGL
jgi:tetratricopeptide (TPR) repeat protein